MERSRKKSGGVQIPKKNRSLDLKSLYESRFSEVRDSKKKISDENDGANVQKKKRKSRKEVPLSYFESDAKKSRKEDVNGVKSELALGQKLSEKGEALHDISLPLGSNGSSFNIPKRPRGSVGSKKKESNQGSQLTRHSESAELNAEVTQSEDGVGPSDRLIQVITHSSGNDCVSSVKSKGKLNGSNSKLKQKSDSKTTVNSSGSNVKVKKKVRAEEVKENTNGSGSASLVGKECNRVVNNGIASPKKQQRNSRKKKDLVLGRGKDDLEASADKSQPSVGSSSDRLFVDFVDDDDDDEENLEQNAARMLSSRFDPSCTGFLSKRKSSAKADGLLFSSSSAQGSFTRQLKSFADGQSPSADDHSRTLRPRRENLGKGVSRKRRHFFEILAQDLDPYWVLNRRIKIFWPLDESWYYGLVNDYNSETKRHRIKYDDREEEIVNLQDEKFKLLLLPSEVPDKLKSRKRSRRPKDLHNGQTAASAVDDSSMGDRLDSEPIASWLASQPQRVKASSKSSKRQRTSQKHPPLVSSLSSEKTDNSNSNVVDSNLFRNCPDCESASVDSLCDAHMGNSSLPGSTHTSQSDRQVVYVRKKYHKISEGGRSVSGDVKAHRTAPWKVTSLSPVSVGLPPTKGGSANLLWSYDYHGKLRLKDVSAKYEEFKFQICLPALPSVESSFEIRNFWLLHGIYMLQHGQLVTSSRAVILQMLFIDTSFGMRFLLYDGCLKQAVALIIEILTAFCQFDEQWNGDVELPMTSIRFQISSSQFPMKQHVFEFYSFSKLKSSKWLYLDSKILQKCHLIKQLPISKCTCGNIKELECENFHSDIHCDGLKHALNEGFKKKFVCGILPMGVTQEAHNRRMSQSAFSMAAEPGKVSQFALSFSATPNLFLVLHLQLLMEHNFAWVSRQHQDALCTAESSGDVCQPSAESAQFNSRSKGTQETTTKIQIGKKNGKAPAFHGFQQKLGMGVVLASGAAGNNSKITSQQFQYEHRKDADELVDASELSSVPTPITSRTHDPRSDSKSDGMAINIPSSEQVNAPLEGQDYISRQASDEDWNVREAYIDKSNTNSFRNSWQHGGSNSVTSPFGHHPSVWPDGSLNFKPNGFSNGPKKPRTQVQYALPFVGCDLSDKQKSPSSKSLPCKRIRKASLKRISDGPVNNQKNVESLTCVANVLVTHGDKGWREYGAHIVLEVDDHNEWKLAVKLSGVTKYSYKVKHILQPGSTNRYSYAMMWKGGKDWVLEFPDRSQWMLFKELHEECYDRNIRAASVKNIPIPGVWLVEDSDEYGKDVPFIRNPTKYFRQVQNDVEMAMDHSRILYDIDSDDEEWLIAHNTRADKHEEISEDFLEKAMNMFEKVSYSQHKVKFTDDVIEELMSGMGSPGADKTVHQYWREKREKIGMSLIRHLQPPLWESYQQQLKDWEHNGAPGLYAFSVGSQGKVPPEKPPMFAFCLRPRGLELPNKGSKQRSHRRLQVSGHHHTSLADQDSLLFGRRSNGHAFGYEKVFHTNSIHRDFSDVSPSLRASTRVLSPRDAHFYLSNGVSEWKGSPRFYKNKSKKLGSYSPFSNQQMMTYNHPRSSGKRNAAQQWIPSHRQGIDQLDSSDLHELRLRDACGAAQLALKLAKFKREKAQRLLHRADLAVHKAVFAVMTADAIKDSSGSSDGIN